MVRLVGPWTAGAEEGDATKGALRQRRKEAAQLETLQGIRGYGSDLMRCQALLTSSKVRARAESAEQAVQMVRRAPDKVSGWCGSTG